LADTCGYKLPTNLQNFMQKDLTDVKIFQNVLEGATFLKHPEHGVSINKLQYDIILCHGTFKTTGQAA